MSTFSYLKTLNPEDTQVDHLNLFIGDIPEPGLGLSLSKTINVPDFPILENDSDSSSDSMRDVSEEAVRLPAIASSNVVGGLLQLSIGDVIAGCEAALSDSIQIGSRDLVQGGCIPEDDAPVMIVPTSPKPDVPPLSSLVSRPANSDEETDDQSLMTGSMSVAFVLSQTNPIAGMPLDHLMLYRPYGRFTTQQAATTVELSGAGDLRSEPEMIRSRVGYGLGQKPTQKATAKGANNLVTADVMARIYTICKVRETRESEIAKKPSYPPGCKVAIETDDGVTLRDFKMVNAALTHLKCVAGGGVVRGNGLEHRLNFQVLDHVNFKNMVVDNALTDRQEYIPGSATLRGLLIQQNCSRSPVNSA